MSQVSFDNLINKYPESKRVSHEIKDWIHAHKDVETIYPKLLAKDFSSTDAGTLAVALTILVKYGILCRVYKVVTPSGVLTEEEFDDPTKIPAKLPDRYEHYFDTAESDVVAIFHKVA